jgi:ABC-type branched-subunit amino acid transport system ATPase component
MKSLQIQNLTKLFGGVAALFDVSLNIESGKVTSIIGPNGSGKTTLVNVLSGVFAQSSGLIVIDNVAVKQAVATEVSSYGITRTFQEVRLFNQMSVLDNILVVLTERGVFGALFEKHNHSHLQQAESLLRKVNLWEKRADQAGSLSYGQRKLLEIVRALAMKAEIYLFDEPFAGLFPEMVKLVVEIIKELRHQGRTVVLIEHNMDLIRELSDVVIVLDGGKFLAAGLPAEVLARTDVLEAYLGE